MTHVGGMYSKQANLKDVCSWNKMWSLKSLDTLKCESRSSLHAVKYKQQPDSVLMLFLLLIQEWLA